MAAGYSRRQVCGLTVAALGASAVSACLPGPPIPRGNRIIATPTDSPADERLKPRLWNTTTVKVVGAGAAALATLNFIQDLQLPGANIPYLTSMTFYAPQEGQFVTIGLYYERNAQSGPARQILTSSAFVLQAISDVDAPLRYEPEHVQTIQSSGISGDALGWFAQNRQHIVETMQKSAEGTALSRVYDCDFSTKPRPPDSTPCALVIAGGNYAGIQVPDTVIAQQVVFS
jgi:hypothetical protein